ncbi:MAG: DUF2378 family protein, partial [Deltaproteobacteria bacterium]|nr:DUF2378 family protein [Deltaproteobacteria bacterium]
MVAPELKLAGRDEARSAAVPRGAGVRFQPLPPELSHRMSLCSDADTARGMFFNGVLQVVKSACGEDARNRCLLATGEDSFVDVFMYPVKSFLPMAWAAVRELGVAEADGLRRLGRQSAADFFSSMSGKTLIALAGQNPRRLAGTIPAAYKAAVSYGDRQITWTGDRACKLVVKRDFMPHPYHEGVVAAALEAMGGKSVKVV